MTTYTYPSESGAGWEYNQAGITYSGETDELTGSKVYYNAVGVSTTYTYENRN